MRDARRAAVWLLTLVIVVLIGDRILASMIYRMALNSRFRFSMLYRGGADADVVIVGDSRGIHSFYAPEIERTTGLRVLNLSYNGMSTEVAEAILADYLERNRPPKLVILELTSLHNDLQLMAALRTYAGRSPRLWKLYAKEHPRAAAAGRMFHLYLLNSDLLGEWLRYFRHSDQGWIIRTTISPELAATKRESFEVLPRRANLDALRRIAAMTRAKGSTLRVVLAPYHRSVETVSVAGLIAAAETEMKAADSRQRVWNYLDALHDDRYFGDRVHTNQAGSEQFIALLRRDGFFDHERGIN